MTYQVSATFNCVSMRKQPGEILKTFEFYVQYTISAEQTNDLGVVVMQDFTMDLHRDVKKMFATTVFVQQDDPQLDDTCQLAQNVADVIILEDVGYLGFAKYLCNEMSTKIVDDGSWGNAPYISELIIQGTRYAPGEANAQ